MPSASTPARIRPSSWCGRRASDSTGIRAASTKQQLRGGVGVFAGRAPYVWISNAYAGTGIEQVALACSTASNCTVPAFNRRSDQRSRSSAPPARCRSTSSIRTSTSRASCARPSAMTATSSGASAARPKWSIRRRSPTSTTRTSTRSQTGVSALDGRPTYARRHEQLADATFLTNTSMGAESVETLQLSKPPWHGVNLSGSYAHQHATSAFDATSSRAISNWRFQHSQGNIFTPTLGTLRLRAEAPLQPERHLRFQHRSVHPHVRPLLQRAERPSVLAAPRSPAFRTTRTRTSATICSTSRATELHPLPVATRPPTAANPCGTRRRSATTS